MRKLSLCLLVFAGILSAQCKPWFDPILGKLTCPPSQSTATGTVTSVGLLGTANQLTVTGTSPITSSGSWTLSIPSVLTLPGTINKLTLTAPATAATLTLADNKTFTVSNTLTLAGTDSTVMTFPTTSATIARTDAANTFTGTQTIGALVATTVNGNTFTTGTGVLTIAASKTLTASNTLTFTGTDSSSVAFGAGGTVLYSSAGSDTYFQFNDGGTAFGGSSNLRYTKASGIVNFGIASGGPRSANFNFLSNTATFALDAADFGTTDQRFEITDNLGGALTHEWSFRHDGSFHTASLIVDNSPVTLGGAGSPFNLNLVHGNASGAGFSRINFAYGTSASNVDWILGTTTAYSDNSVQFYRNSGAGNIYISGANLRPEMGIVDSGTKFTASGCSNSTTVGGATAGKYSSGTTGTCTVVITMGGASAVTAPNGWACNVHDQTTAANFQGQSASSTTTATFTGTTVSGDVISFSCTGY